MSRKIKLTGSISCGVKVLQRQLIADLIEVCPKRGPAGMEFFKKWAPVFAAPFMCGSCNFIITCQLWPKKMNRGNTGGCWICTPWPTEKKPAVINWGRNIENRARRKDGQDFRRNPR